MTMTKIGKTPESMTDWELDKTVACIVKEITRHRGTVLLLVDEGLELVHITGGGTWCPSSYEQDFADVKREIERRGMPWQVSYDPDNEMYWFAVRGKYRGWCFDESECRAGCIAFLRAIGWVRGGDDDN